MTELADLSETDASNTAITGANIAEGCAPSGINNAIRNFAGLIKRAFNTLNFRVRDNTDQTKLLALDLSGITTATTRTLAVQDKSGTIALTSDITSSDTLAKTANYTVLAADAGKTILCDATSAAFTITLLAAATAGDGFVVTIKKTDSSVNIVTVDGDGSETIDGATTYLLRPDDEAVTLICNGTAWFVKGTAPARQALPRAWVRYNGSTNTVTSSFGVSGITKNGAGDYTVTFTNAFANADYMALGSVATTGSSAILSITGNMTIAAGSFRFVVRNASATNTDADFVNLVFYA